jgi:nucleotide-binding universal stress UspA family protein
VDFSDISRRALAHAVALGRQHEAGVTVVHVVPDPATLAAEPFDDARAPAPERARRHQWAEDVRRFTECFGEPRPEVVIAEGVADAEILAAAARLHAGLLCLGTHGRSGFERWVLGSVADKVLRKARLPVVTVAPRCEPPAPAGPYGRVLCAIDLSPSSVPLAECAAGLARAAGADALLTLLHCVEDVPEDDTMLLRAGFELRPYRRYREEQARTRLAEMAAAVQAPGLRVESAVSSGRAWRAILHRAEEHREQMIVLGAHVGEGPAGHFGSTTDRVIREAGCPVLTWRAAGSRP